MRTPDIARLPKIVLSLAHQIEREPTPTECPTWCVMRDLEAAGNAADPDDPFHEVAFWEYIAWASVELFGPDADAFAQTCRGIADECAARIAV